MKKIALISFVLVLALLMSSCSVFRRTAFNDDGSLEDSRKNITYKFAPACYEPIAIGDRYFTNRTSGVKYKFYKIEGLDPTEWLSDGNGSVLYASDVSLPTLSELDPYKILLCRTEQDITFETISDKEEIDEVLDVYLNGNAVEYPAIASQYSMTVKFCSSKYEGIYYKLTYFRLAADRTVYYPVDDPQSYTPELEGEGVEFLGLLEDSGTESGYVAAYNVGRTFIYNSAEGRCVVAGDVLSEYVSG